MLLTGFGMAGRLRSPHQLPRRPTRRIRASVWGEEQPEGLFQGPLYEDGRRVDQATEESGAGAADRLTLTGWIDLASLPSAVAPRPGLQPGVAVAALQRALDEQDDQAVRRLRGDFVLAHLSPDRGSLTLCRAVNALIPVFWREENGCLAWSAEPTQLIERGQPALGDVDVDVLPMIIAERGMPQDRSWFRGIRRLPAGEQLRRRHGAVAEVRRFDEFRPVADAPKTIAEAAEGLHERLAQACARMLPDGAPSVLLLSGGIDSAAVAHEVGQSSQNATAVHYTLDSFPGYDTDRTAAEAVAHASGLSFVPYEMSKHTRSGGDYLQATEGSALPQTHVPLQGLAAAVGQAEAQGATFVLSGLLADQVLAHDLQRSLLEVAGWSILDPRVAGGPIWQLLKSAASSSYADGRSGSKSSSALRTLGYLYRVASGDPTTALPDRNTIVHPVGFTDQADRRVNQALRESAEYARSSVRTALEHQRRGDKGLPRGITSLFQLAQAFNTANLQAGWLNHCLPKERLFGAPFADRDVIEYALSLPTRHRLGFGYGMTVDKLALRVAYAERGVPASIGRRMQQARLDAIPGVFVHQNFEACTSLLNRQSLLCSLGVLSEEFVDNLSPSRVHRNGEEIARLCVIEQWLRGLG